MSVERVECRLAVILASDNATGSVIDVLQRLAPRIALPADGPVTWLFRPTWSITMSVHTRTEPYAVAAVSQDRVVGSTGPNRPHLAP